MLTHVGTKEIETERLILRRFKIEDAKDMFKNWASDPENVKYLSWNAHKNIEETKNILKEWIASYENKNSYHWAITLKETSEIIGGIDVILLLEHIDCCEIGYVLSKKYWNQRIMTEALESVENYLFQKANFNRIQARHDVDNVASGKVMVKAGMKFEGVLRQSDKKNTGKWCDTAIYSVLKSEFKK